MCVALFWWTVKCKQSRAEPSEGKAARVTAGERKQNSPFQSSSDASRVFLVRLLEIVETVDGGKLGGSGDVRVGDGSARCMNENSYRRIENRTYPFNPAAT